MRLPFRRKGEKTESLSIEEILEKLQLIRVRLDRRVREMESKHKILFDQVVEAYMEKDRDKAAIYAEELAELRRMLRRLTHANLLLEGMIYRIEAVKDLSDASAVMTPLRSALATASAELRGIAPTASNELDALMRSVEDLSLSVGRFPEPINAETSLSDEARRILEEASTLAAQRRQRRD